MQILSLYIEDYKNIHRQTFDLANMSSPILLIGLNGSGKSNVLEAISLIFKAMLTKGRSPFNYNLTFERNGREFTVSDDDFSPVPRDCYPSSVIACYSGEDRRWWHDSFEEYYNGYFNRSINNDSNSNDRLLYVDSHNWKTVFIALLAKSMYDQPIANFLKEICHYEYADSIAITFHIDENKLQSYQNHYAIRWLRRIFEEVGNLTFTPNQLFSYELPVNGQTLGVNDLSFPKTMFDYLFLLSMPEKSEENNIEKVITDTDISINGIPFENLSEGEKKMLLIEFINTIYGDEHSLVLLDEPDAHVHVGNAEKLVRLISDFPGQTIMTSHSPLTVGCIPQNAMYMSDGEVKDLNDVGLMDVLSNGSVSLLEDALMLSYKKVVITEGPDDITHIRRAIQAFNDQRYESLTKLSFLFCGGADQVRNHYDICLKKVYPHLDKIVYVFDNDHEGRKGAKEAQKIANTLNDGKIATVVYSDRYPENKEASFYLEDLFPRSVYSEISLPDIHGEPSFNELKKFSTYPKSIKDKISEKSTKGKITDEEYKERFRPFLDELLNIVTS